MTKVGKVGWDWKKKNPSKQCEFLLTNHVILWMISWKLVLSSPPLPSLDINSKRSFRPHFFASEQPRLRYSKLIQKILGDLGVMFLLLSSREEFEKWDLDFLETRNAKLSRSREIETSRRERWTEYARSSPRCKRSVGPHFLASKRPRLLHSNPKKKRSFADLRTKITVGARSSWLHVAIVQRFSWRARVHAFDVEPYAWSSYWCCFVLASPACAHRWIDRMLLHRPRCNITGPSSSRTQDFPLALALPRDDVDVVPETSSVLFYLDLVAT